MTQLTKKQKSFKGKVDTNKLYPLADALGIVKECAKKGLKKEISRKISNKQKNN